MWLWKVVVVREHSVSEYIPYKSWSKFVFQWDTVHRHTDPATTTITTTTACTRPRLKTLPLSQIRDTSTLINWIWCGYVFPPLCSVVVGFTGGSLPHCPRQCWWTDCQTKLLSEVRFIYFLFFQSLKSGVECWHVFFSFFSLIGDSLLNVFCKIMRVSHIKSLPNSVKCM